MDLSIREAALFLGVSERTVRNYISSGKLPAHRAGRQLFVAREAVQVFRRAANNPRTTPGFERERPVESISRDDLMVLMERLAALEQKIEDKSNIFRDNDEIELELRRKEEQLVQKEIEIEKLRRDLVYQKRLHEKELEDQQKYLEEKRALLQIEDAEKRSMERKHFEERLNLEKKIWSEQMERESQRHAQELAQAEHRESFWSRLMRMMTWS